MYTFTNASLLVFCSVLKNWIIIYFHPLTKFSVRFLFLTKKYVPNKGCPSCCTERHWRADDAVVLVFFQEKHLDLIVIGLENPVRYSKVMLPTSRLYNVVKNAQEQKYPQEVNYLKGVIDLMFSTQEQAMACELRLKGKEKKKRPSIEKKVSALKVQVFLCWFVLDIWLTQTWKPDSSALNLNAWPAQSCYWSVQESEPQVWISEHN